MNILALRLSISILRYLKDVFLSHWQPWSAALKTGGLANYAIKGQQNSMLTSYAT